MNIFTAAFGETYRRRASLLVTSLRLSGFAGDVIALTDGLLYGSGADVRQIPLEEWTRLDLAGDNARYARSRLPLFGDEARMPDGPLMYLDADCLAFQDPSPLFEIEGPATQFYPERNFLNQCPNLRPDELDFTAMLKQPAPCSGAVLFPTDLVERRVFLELWDYENRSMVMDDNTALAAVLWRRYGLRGLPGIGMKYAGASAGDSMIVHYLDPFADKMEDDFVARFGRDKLPWMPSKGLGDTISKITAAVGIEPCAGCKERAKWINRWFPYSR